MNSSFLFGGIGGHGFGFFKTPARLRQLFRWIIAYNKGMQQLNRSYKLSFLALFCFFLGIESGLAGFNFNILNNSQCHTIGREAACKLHDCQTPEQNQASFKLAVSSLEQMVELPEIIDLSDPRIIEKFNQVDTKAIPSVKGLGPSNRSIVQPALDYHKTSHNNPQSYLFGVKGDKEVQKFIENLKLYNRVDIADIEGEALQTFLRNRKKDHLAFKVLRIKKRWVVACAVDACVMTYAFFNAVNELAVLGNAAASAAFLLTGMFLDQRKIKQSVDKMLYMLSLTEAKHKEAFAYRMAVPLDLRYEDGSQSKQLFELYLARLEQGGELVLTMGNRVLPVNSESP